MNRLAPIFAVLAAALRVGCDTAPLAISGVVRSTIAISGAASCALVASCTTSPTAPEARTFNALADAWSAVDHSMSAYAQLCAAGLVDAATQARVDAAHEKFRLSFLASVRLARHNWTAATPAETDALARDVLRLIQELTQ